MEKVSRIFAECISTAVCKTKKDTGTLKLFYKAKQSKGNKIKILRGKSSRSLRV